MFFYSKKAKSCKVLCLNILSLNILSIITLCIPRFRRLGVHNYRILFFTFHALRFWKFLSGACLRLLFLAAAIRPRAIFLP